MKSTSNEQHSSDTCSTPFKRAYVIVLIAAIAASTILLSRVVSSRDKPLAAIKSIHSRTTTAYASPGRMSSSAEAWIVLPNKERVETDDVIRVRNGVDQWLLNKRSNRYIVSRHPSNPQIQAEKWSKPDSTVDNWRHVRPNLTVSNVKKQLDGADKDAVEVLLPDVKGGSQKVDLFPETNTGRIATKITYQLDDQGKLVWTERVDYEYNRDVDNVVFTSMPPTGAVEVPDMTSLQLAPGAHLK